MLASYSGHTGKRNDAYTISARSSPCRRLYQHIILPLAASHYTSAYLERLAACTPIMEDVTRKTQHGCNEKRSHWLLSIAIHYVETLARRHGWLRLLVADDASRLWHEAEKSRLSICRALCAVHTVTMASSVRLKVFGSDTLDAAGRNLDYYTSYYKTRRSRIGRTSKYTFRPAGLTIVYWP